MSVENWETLKNCMVSAGEVVVWRGGNTQLDWFTDSADTLQPLLDEKNAAYDRFLQAKSQSNKKEFRRNQRIVKRAVDTAKEDWICKVASDAEKAKKDSHQRWMCVRQLQMACRGCRPRRSTALMKEDGEMTSSPEEGKKQWHHHFSRILNIPSEYSQEVIDLVPRRIRLLELDVPPTLEELLSALSKLKKGKVVWQD